MPYQSIATTLVFVRLRWLTCTVCCCLKSLRGLAFLRWQGRERPGCKVKGKSGSPNTPPAVSSPSTGTNSICMVNGLTYGGHSSKKVVLPIRKMAGKVLGGACRECSKVVARWRDRGGASTLGLCASTRFHFQLGKRVPAGLAWRAGTRQTIRGGEGQALPRWGRAPVGDHT